MRKDFVASQAGATYVEMVLSIGIFVLIIVLVIELTMYGVKTTTTQYLVHRTLRKAAVLDFKDTSCEGIDKNFFEDPANAARKVQCIEEVVQNFAEPVGLVLDEDEDIHITRSADLAALSPGDACKTERPSVPENAGIANEFIAICIETKFLNLFFEAMSVNIKSYGIAKNEPTA